MRSERDDDRPDSRARRLHPETLAVHGLNEERRADGATAAPICQSSAFAYPSAASLEAVFAGRAPGYVYSRLGNPTVTPFEQRLMALEGGIGAVAFASGMAAISATVLALASAGDELVVGNGRFGGLLTLRLASRAACFRFLDGLRLIRNLANLGDVRSLAIHPASTFCQDLTEAACRAVGVTDDLVRLSIGIEHADDIVADLERGLAAI